MGRLFRLPGLFAEELRRADREVLDRFKLEIEVRTYPETERLYSFTFSCERGYWDQQGLTERGLLGPPRTEFRRKCEQSVEELLKEARGIIRDDLEAENKWLWSDIPSGMRDSEEWIKALRKSLESGL